MPWPTMSRLFSRSRRPFAPMTQLSIRARLIILAMIAIVPVVGERVRGLEIGRSDRLKLASTQMVELARQGASAQLAMLSNMRSVLETIALTPYFKNPHDAGCNAYLASLEPVVDSLNAISILSDDNKIACSSAPDAIGINLSDRAQIKLSLERRSFAVGDVVIGRRVKVPNLAVALAKFDAAGHREGVVSGTVDLQWLGRLVTQVADREGMEAFVIDRNNSIVVHYPEPESWRGLKVGDSSIGRIVRTNSSGTVTTDDFAGARKVYEYFQLPGTQSYFVVGIEESVLLANINRQVWRAYATLALIVLLFIVAVWLGGEHAVVRPIKRLMRRAAYLGNGDYTHTASLDDMPREFRPLSRALVVIQEKLALRELQLRRENRELDSLAQCDALTGIANRRALDLRLHELVAQCVALRQSVAVFMLDVDHFKSYNDLYGHLAGDECLKKIAGTLASAVRREADVVARFGGEEFAVVLPGLDATAALAMAERFRKAIEQLAIPHQGSSHAVVTVSVGVVNTVPGKDQEGELLECADAALYRAKRQGRNAVCGFKGAGTFAIAS
jgi:diguanylate cyclase (GGDEF)-like protein